jgi:hypothetical protein
MQGLEIQPPVLISPNETVTALRPHPKSISKDIAKYIRRMVDIPAHLLFKSNQIASLSVNVTWMAFEGVGASWPKKKEVR